MSEKLKPCPFCGKTDPVGVFTHSERNTGWEVDERYDYLSVCCAYDNGGCGAAGGYRETKEEAIEIWNKRAPLYTPVKPEDIANGWYWMVDPDGRESVCGVLGLTVFCGRPQPLRGLIAEGYTFYRIPDLEVAE